MTSAETRPRPRRRWVWMMVAVATVVAFAVPFRLQLVVPKGGPRHGVDSPVVYRRGISDLQVQASGGTAVAIRAGRPGQVTVSSSLSWVFRKPTVSQVWHGRTLWLGATCPKPDPFGCQVTTVITIPAATAVQALAGAGTVTVAGLSGPLHLSATSGLLVARDVSGPVWATVTSGSVIAHTGLTSPRVSASASSGQLALAFDTPPQRLTIVVDVGSARITLPPGSLYHVVRSGGPGPVYLAPGLSHAGSSQVITVSVGAGEATIGYPPGSG